MRAQLIKTPPEFLITSPHPCSYLQDELAQTVFLSPGSKPTNKEYSILVQNGFRRSGEHIYRPNCEACSACISVRVCVNEYFTDPQYLRRSFGRILKKNIDLEITHSTDADRPELYTLYESYISDRHLDGDMYPGTAHQYASFLEQNLGNCEYLIFTLNKKPVVVAVTDLLSDGMAAVYTFFDCRLNSRSLGTMGILYQLQYCRRLGLPYLYLGYWIKECRKMNYKATFQPLECYVDGNWTRLIP